MGTLLLTNSLLPVQSQLNSRLLSKDIKCQQSCSLLISIIPPQRVQVIPTPGTLCHTKNVLHLPTLLLFLATFLSGMYQFYQTTPVPPIECILKAVFKWFLFWEFFLNSARRSLLDLFWWDFVTFCLFTIFYNCLCTLPFSLDCKILKGRKDDTYFISPHDPSTAPYW